MAVDQKALLKEAQRMENERSAHWDSVWQTISEYVMPNISTINTWKTPGLTGFGDRLYDHTAIEANLILAEGQLNYITPLGQVWASYRPGPKDAEGDSEARRHLDLATHDVFGGLNRSNFHGQVFDLFMNRGGLGTGAMLIDADVFGEFRFLSLRPGTFCIGEDAWRNPDKLVRKWELTAEQAVAEYTLEGDSLPEKVRQAAANPQTKTQKFCFYHCIYKRSVRDTGRSDPNNMEWASVHICRDGEGHLVRESGFPYQPFVATRYIRWGDEVYGFSPSILAMPLIRSLNFLVQSMDALVELMIHPRVLVPSGMKGQVDFRPHGVTFFDEFNPVKPEEWLTNGRYDVGRDREQSKTEQLRRAFHVDLFQMFSNEDVNSKVMTAREVAARQAENISRFSPIFHLLQKEFLDPLMRTLYAIRLSSGKLEQPPASLYTDGGGVALPNVQYRSRIAQAIDQVDIASYLQFGEIVLQHAQVDPLYAKMPKADVALPDIAYSLGVPTQWVHTAEEFQEVREAYAEAQESEATVDAIQRAGPAAAALAKAQ